MVPIDIRPGGGYPDDRGKRPGQQAADWIEEGG